ncbi:hypothetical protein M3Y94_00491800 [Aphelenchoides besseyi]|nr:hypothetical protein M3Y94_00491800 [Aphelenchoides besseyi]KAI6217923.1 hypothetical protein M3Y95_01194400 [Aphelenchoides besseyi]
MSPEKPAEEENRANCSSAQLIVEKFDEIEKDRQWFPTFVKLQDDSDAQEQELQFSYTHALSTKNQAKNRYCNVVPYDHNRVILSNPNDYINASPINVEWTGGSYIFTQGPLPQTSGDFWTMVWEQNSRIIVMLSTCIEHDSIKCHDYFPSSKENTKKYGNFVVELVNETENGSYVVRELELKFKKNKKTETRTVHHLQFIKWADFDVPELNVFMDFVEAVRDLDDSMDEKTPIVSHCSAGIGRTGTFAICDIFLSALRQNKTENFPQVTELVLELRKSRMWLIQTPPQLRFGWQAICEWLRRFGCVRNVADEVEEPKEEPVAENESVVN